MPGGIFICRVYELLSRFSAALVYLMYRIFEEVSNAVALCIIEYIIVWDEVKKHVV